MSEKTIGSQIVEEINQRQDEVLNELDLLNQRIEQTLVLITGKSQGLSVTSAEG